MSEPKPNLANFHQNVLMEDMLDAVGVSVLDVIDFDGGKSYVRARQNCRECSCQETCRSWLAENDEGAPQAFCPNSNFFEILKR